MSGAGGSYSVLFDSAGASPAACPVVGTVLLIKM